jgi:hypothetical protein
VRMPKDFVWSDYGVRPEAVEPQNRLHEGMRKLIESGELYPCYDNPYFYTDYEDLASEVEDVAFQPLTEDQCEQLCHGCPLLKLCYEFAVTDQVKYGVWGGVDFGKDDNSLF